MFLLLKEGKCGWFCICNLKSLPRDVKAGNKNSTGHFLMAQPLGNKNRLAEIIQTSDKFSEEAVANIVKVVSDAIRDKSDVYVQEKAEMENHKEEALKQKQETEAKLQKVEEELSASQEKLSALESEQKAAKALQLFNSKFIFFKFSKY